MKISLAYPSTRTDNSDMLTQFLAKVRADAILRERFMQAPAQTLLEHGIDSSNWDLPEQISSEQIDAFLAFLGEIDKVPEPPQTDPSRYEAVTPVYGPPPALDPRAPLPRHPAKGEDKPLFDRDMILTIAVILTFLILILAYWNR